MPTSQLSPSRLGLRAAVLACGVALALPAAASARRSVAVPTHRGIVQAHCPLKLRNRSAGSCKRAAVPRVQSAAAPAHRVGAPSPASPAAAPGPSAAPLLTAAPEAPLAAPAPAPPQAASEEEQGEVENPEAGASPSQEGGIAPGDELGFGAEPESTPGGEASTAARSGGAAATPIDFSYLTSLPFGRRSFWVQPWRAYLDTWPASRLLNAVGINFTLPTPENEATAQLLQDSGVKLARVSIGWNALSYKDPTKFVPYNEAGIRSRLTALHDHGIRPLILLNANSEGPTPAKLVQLETLQEAPAGATSVTLSATSAAAVVPGKTGFNGIVWGGYPDVLITSVGPGNVAKLSRPLISPLPSGSHSGVTLLYEPFQVPVLRSGKPNPAYQATLAGWLNYVQTVSKLAASIVGPEGYDLELWNELSFGSQFLNAEAYYGGPPVTEGESGEGLPETAVRHPNRQILRKLLEDTVAFVRSPASGIGPGVGFTNGFASQTPFPSGANAPLGMDALSKHPYVGTGHFPAGYRVSALRPVNALGFQDTRAHEQSPFTPLFVPTYQVLYPEVTLTGLGTETLIRDLSPTTNYIYGFPHGRFVGPPGGKPVQKWITEFNLNIGPRTEVMGPDGVTPQTGVTLSTQDREHFHAKALLRSLVANVNKGMEREYFFAVNGMVSEDFFNQVKANPGTYPGDEAGGEIMRGFRQMLARFQGPGPTGTARQLTLNAIRQEGNHAQFQGDGTPAHPSLLDREVLAVLPFQSSPSRFVIPVYVMTSDLMTLYRPSAAASDTSRFDLPGENFRITLGNLPETQTAPTVGAYDPLQNCSTAARLVRRHGSEATFEIKATDYPRLLTLEFAGA